MGKFLVEIIGAGFTLTMQGSGDMAAAQQTLEGVFEECTVTARSFGEPVDMSGRE